MGNLRWTTALRVLTACVLYLLSHTPPIGAMFFSLPNPDKPGEPCVIMDSNFTIQLSAYHKVTGELIGQETRTSDDPEISVRGECSHDRRVRFFLEFPNGGKFSFYIFIPEGPSTNVYFAPTVDFHPNEVFGSKVNFTFEVHLSGGMRPAGSWENSYLCRKRSAEVYEDLDPEPGDFTFKAEVVIDGIQLQGFNVRGGKFGDPYMCPKFVNLYTVECHRANYTCIVLRAAITLEIGYDVMADTGNTTKKELVEIEVPGAFNKSGHCSLTPFTQDLTVEFYKDWKLTITFNQTSNQSLDISTLSSMGRFPTYEISNITLDYVIDDEKFPGAVEPPGTKHFAAPGHETADFPKKPSEDAGYYKCVNPLELTLSEEVKVKTTQLRFKAFNQDNALTFPSHPDQCLADDEPHDDDDGSNLALIIGSCVGGVLLVALLVLLTVKCRNRKRDKYIQM